nr:MarC family protein [uncultured Alistipes sp.]
MLKESFVFMFISSFMALFPVANPVGTGFIINGFLSGLDRSERRSIVRRIAVNYLLIGIGSLAIGHFVLSLFGLSLPIVQLGGGLLICKTALQWLGDSDASTGSAPDKSVDPISVRNLESRVFYPITFPISIGPGSISVIFTLMASVNIKDGLGKIIINYAVIAFVIFLMCLILYVILSQGQKITKKVGVTGTMIINKMVAFFTFCVGIQIIAEGVEKIFHLSLS